MTHAPATRPLSLRVKLFVSAVALVIFSVLVMYLYASTETIKQTRDRIQSDMLVRLALVAEHVSVALIAPDDLRGWDSLAGHLGAVAEARITILDRSGVVLGDSMIDTDRLSSIERHDGRPEFDRALAGRVGVVERYSATTERKMLYVATKVQLGEGQQGVVRLALPMHQIDEVLAVLHRRLAWAAALGIIASLFVAYFVAEAVSRPVRLLTGTARRMAGGDLETRAPLRGAGEFADLSGALDMIAKNLSMTLGALRKERDRMQGILSSMDEGVLFLDEDRRVALVNPKLRELLLLPPELTGRSVLETIRHAELKELLDSALDDDDEEGPVQGEISIGGLHPRLLLVRARRLEGPEVGLVAVFMDVTETRRLENLRREFVANVSHELRTPVTSIRSAAETLEGVLSTDSGMAGRFVDIISRNATRLQSLVEDLLDLSRIESRQFSLTLEPVSPKQVIEQVLALHGDRVRKREVEVLVEVAEDCPKVCADRKALEHVLSNLIDNAVKYAGAKKQVRITSTVEDDKVRISVTDNGQGIAPRHLPRIFERFYRVDAGRSRDLGGTGLGLSIVKNLVESMSGKVSVESEVGVSTSFHVRLPRMDTERRTAP